MHTIRVAVIDDEPLHRQWLTRLLREAQCEVIAELASGTQLMDWLVGAPSVDALFLDIEMPGLSGLEVMDYLTPLPPTVLVTSHKAYAVKAFETATVDYLIKPVNRERLAQTLTRIRQLLTTPPAADTPALLPLASDKYCVKDGKLNRLFTLAGTTHFEVKDNVVWSWSEGKCYRCQWSALSEVEGSFPTAGLVRIQRHILLRPGAITGYTVLPPGRLQVMVPPNITLEVSQNATPHIKRCLDIR